ncbi:hypothetical protein AKO1_006256 [Acrasis kona]|uniref:Uncharacterized protein n=1 Tax=Acrasis kona TaxID=1008807 RepID=A0AAW2YGI5_9EUKA
MYSKIPENVKLKKQQQQRRNSDEDIKDTPTTPSRPEDCFSATPTLEANNTLSSSYSGQQDRIENIEKTLLELQQRPEDQAIKKIVDSIQEISTKQESQHQEHLKMIEELKAGQDDIRRSIRSDALMTLFADSSDVDRFALNNFEFSLPELPQFEPSSEHVSKKRKIEHEQTPINVYAYTQNGELLKEGPSGIAEVKVNDTVSLRFSHQKHETMFYFVLCCDLVDSRVECLSGNPPSLVVVNDKKIDCSTKTLYAIERSTTATHPVTLSIDEHFIIKGGRGMLRLKVFGIAQSNLDQVLLRREGSDQLWTVSNRVMIVNG